MNVTVSDGSTQIEVGALIEKIGGFEAATRLLSDRLVVEEAHVKHLMICSLPGCRLFDPEQFFNRSDVPEMTYGHQFINIFLNSMGSNRAETVELEVPNSFVWVGKFHGSPSLDAVLGESWDGFGLHLSHLAQLLCDQPNGEEEGPLEANGLVNVVCIRIAQQELAEREGPVWPVFVQRDIEKAAWWLNAWPSLSSHMYKKTWNTGARLLCRTTERP